MKRTLIFVILTAIISSVFLTSSVSKTPPAFAQATCVDSGLDFSSACTGITLFRQPIRNYTRVECTPYVGDTCDDNGDTCCQSRLIEAFATWDTGSINAPIENGAGFIDDMIAQVLTTNSQSYMTEYGTITLPIETVSGTPTPTESDVDCPAAEFTADREFYAYCRLDQNVHGVNNPGNDALTDFMPAEATRRHIFMSGANYNSGITESAIVQPYVDCESTSTDETTCDTAQYVAYPNSIDVSGNQIIIDINTMLGDIKSNAGGFPANFGCKVIASRRQTRYIDSDGGTAGCQAQAVQQHKILSFIEEVGLAPRITETPYYVNSINGVATTGPFNVPFNISSSRISVDPGAFANPFSAEYYIRFGSPTVSVSGSDPAVDLSNFDAVTNGRFVNIDYDATSISLPNSFLDQNTDTNTIFTATLTGSPNPPSNSFEFIRTTRVPDVAEMTNGNYLDQLITDLDASGIRAVFTRDGETAFNLATGVASIPLPIWGNPVIFTSPSVGGDGDGGGVFLSEPSSRMANNLQSNPLIPTAYAQGACVSKFDCAVGQVCYESICTVGDCTSAGECGDGFACHEFQCIPTGGGPMIPYGFTVVDQNGDPTNVVTAVTPTHAETYGVPFTNYTNVHPFVIQTNAPQVGNWAYVSFYAEGNNVNWPPDGGGDGGGAVSIHFSTKNGSEWNEIAVEHFGKFPEQKNIKGNGNIKSINGKVEIRIEQMGADESHIDYLGLAVDNKIVPVTKLIDANTGENLTKKAIKFDKDLADIHGKTLLAVWENIETDDADILMIAREATIDPNTKPFVYPSTDTTYKVELTKNQAIVVDGKITAGDKLGEADATEWSTPTTGHPDADTNIYFNNDGKNLYVTIDAAFDNTDDDLYEAKVMVHTKDGEKTFTLNSKTGTYGKRGFVYTEAVAYQHSVAEMRIPLSEIGAVSGDTLNVRVSYYGSGGVGDPVGDGRRTLFTIPIVFSAPFIGDVRGIVGGQVLTETVPNQGEATSDSAEIEADIDIDACTLILDNCRVDIAFNEAESTSLNPDAVELRINPGDPESQVLIYNNTAIVNSGGTISAAVQGLTPGGSPGVYVFTVTMYQDNNFNGYGPEDLINELEYTYVLETPEIDEASFATSPISVDVNTDFQVIANVLDNNLCSPLNGGVDCFYRWVPESGNFFDSPEITDSTGLINLTNTSFALDIDGAVTDMTGYLNTFNAGDALDPRSPVDDGPHQVRLNLYGEYEGTEYLVDTAVFDFTVDNDAPDLEAAANDAIHAVQQDPCEAYPGHNEAAVPSPQSAIYSTTDPVSFHFHTVTGGDERNGGFAPESYVGGAIGKFSDGDPVAETVPGGFAPLASYVVNGGAVIVTPATFNCDAYAFVPNNVSTLSVDATVSDQWGETSAESITVNILPQIESVTPSSDPVTSGQVVTMTVNAINVSGLETYGLTQSGGTAVVINQPGGATSNVFNFTAPPALGILTFDAEVNDNADGFGNENATLNGTTVEVAAESVELNNNYVSQHSGDDVMYTASVIPGGGGPYSYTWEMLDSDGTTVIDTFPGAQNTLNDTDDFTFTAPDSTGSITRIFRVTVNGASASDSVNIVNAAPTISVTIAGEDIDGAPQNFALTNGVTNILKQAPDIVGQPVPSAIPTVNMVITITDPDGDALNAPTVPQSGGGIAVAPTINWAEPTLEADFDFGRSEITYTYQVTVTDVFGATSVFTVPLKIEDDSSFAVSVTGTADPWAKGSQYSLNLSTANTDPSVGEVNKIETTVCGNNPAIVSLTNGDALYAATANPFSQVANLAIITGSDSDNCGTSKVDFTAHHPLSKTQIIKSVVLSSEIGGGSIWTGQREGSVTANIGSGTSALNRTFSCDRNLQFTGLGETVQGLYEQQFSMTVKSVSSSPSTIFSTTTFDPAIKQFSEVLAVSPGAYEVECKWLDWTANKTANISGSQQVALTTIAHRELSEESLRDTVIPSDLKLALQESLFEVNLLVTHDIPSFEEPKKLVLKIPAVGATVYPEVIIEQKYRNILTASLNTDTDELTLMATTGYLPEEFNANLWIVPRSGLVRDTNRSELTAIAELSQPAATNRIGVLDGGKSFTIRTGGITNYHWELLENPLVNASDVKLSQTNPLSPIAYYSAPPVEQETLLVFKLNVTDSNETKDKTLAVKVFPHDYVQAVLGASDMSVISGQTVVINATNSIGPIADFKWETNQQDQDENPQTFTFTAGSPGKVTVSLNVLGENPAFTDTKNITIDVFAPASRIEANAGNDMSAKTGDTVILEGKGVCIGCGSITYQWEQVAGRNVSIDNRASAITSFTIPSAENFAGTYKFQLTVQNNSGQMSEPDFVTVTVTHEPSATAIPKIDATSPIINNGELPLSRVTDITLSGTDSYGTGALSYEWNQVSGPSQLNFDTASAKPSFRATRPGKYILSLTVTDKNGSSEPVNLELNFAGADAGDNQVVPPGSTVRLTAENSILLNGGNATQSDARFTWEQMSGSPVQLTGGGSANPSFTAPNNVGDIVFRVTMIADGINYIESYGEVTISVSSQNLGSLINNFMSYLIAPKAFATMERNTFAVEIGIEKMEDGEGKTLMERNGESNQTVVAGYFDEEAQAVAFNYSTIGLIVILVIIMLYMALRKRRR